jgi:hypothetical protein
VAAVEKAAVDYLVSPWFISQNIGIQIRILFCSQSRQ